MLCIRPPGKAGFARQTSSMSIASRSPTRDHTGSFTPGRVTLDLQEHLGPHYELTSKGLRLVGGSKSRTRGQLQESWGITRLTLLV